MSQEPLIKLENVCKTFPGVKALDGICLEIQPGQVHALVGENGAGKSTLIKILSGTYKPDPCARITIEGQEKSFLTPMEALNKGILVIYQDFSLFPNLTVAENISISHQMEKNGPFVNWQEMRVLAKEALEALEVDIDVDAQLETLSTAKQQLVAIARAIASNAKLIVMDEPTSTLSQGEVEALFNIIRKLQAKNIAILFVSHKLEELFVIADTFTVIRDGQYIGTYPKEEMDNDKLISLMVGRKVEFIHQSAEKIGETLMEVRGLSKAGCFKDISFTLRSGEIVGITGLVGAGRTEVVQAICGIDCADTGDILIKGKPANIRSMRDAMRYGIGYVPESRLTEGLVLTKDVADNTVITILKELRGKSGLISYQKKRDTAADWIKRLNVKPGYPDMVVQKLSGGNQQRVVISKWLAIQPDILIIDEPTNGIDIGAKSEIHNLLRSLSNQGMGIIMISSELPEVLSISDRVLVMRRGKINAEFDGATADQESLLNAGLMSSSSAHKG